MSESRIMSLEISKQECRRLANESSGRALLTKADPGESAFWMHLSHKWERMADSAVRTSELSPCPARKVQQTPVADAAGSGALSVVANLPELGEISTWAGLVAPVGTRRA
jgi:hypothetical protein